MATDGINLTPTAVSGWLECDHTLTLRKQGVLGQFSGGAFAKLVTQKGMEHEEACLRAYEAAGLTPLDLRTISGASFSSRAENAQRQLQATAADVVYQLPLEHLGMRGIADFVIRVDAKPGFSEWEPVDAKLARASGKPGHLLQLCFYAEAIESITGLPPEHVHLALGSKQTESFLLSEFAPYWRRVRHQLLTSPEVVSLGGSAK